MEIKERKVQFPNRKMVTKLDSNYGIKETYYVDLENHEGNEIEEGTAINKELLDQINWKDDEQITFEVLSPGKEYPDINGTKTVIYTKSNGETWVIPAGNISKQFELGKMDDLPYLAKTNIRNSFNSDQIFNADTYVNNLRSASGNGTINIKDSLVPIAGIDLGSTINSFNKLNVKSIGNGQLTYNLPSSSGTLALKNEVGTALNAIQKTGKNYANGSSLEYYNRDKEIKLFGTRVRMGARDVMTSDSTSMVGTGIEFVNKDINFYSKQDFSANKPILKLRGDEFYYRHSLNNEGLIKEECYSMYVSGNNNIALNSSDNFTITNRNSSGVFKNKIELGNDINIDGANNCSIYTSCSGSPSEISMTENGITINAQATTKPDSSKVLRIENGDHAKMVFYAGDRLSPDQTATMFIVWHNGTRMMELSSGGHLYVNGIRIN